MNGNGKVINSQAAMDKAVKECATFCAEIKRKAQGSMSPK